MNKKSAQHTDLDALLAEMPVEPSKGFAERVLADCKIEKLLQEMPLEPQKEFAEETLTAARRSRRTRANFFHWIHFAAAAGVAAVSAVFLWEAKPAYNAETAWISRIEQTVQNDPELSLLAQTEDDSFLFDELLSTSEILSSIDPSVLEIFAYND